MVKLAPSTVVMVAGTTIGAVVAQLPVNVNTAPVRSPAHGPSVEGTASAAGATPTTTATAAASNPTLAPTTPETRASRRGARSRILRPERPDGCGLGRIVATAHPTHESSNAAHRTALHTINRTTHNGKAHRSRRRPDLIARS